MLRKPFAISFRNSLYQQTVGLNYLISKLMTASHAHKSHLTSLLKDLIFPLLLRGLLRLLYLQVPPARSQGDVTCHHPKHTD